VSEAPRRPTPERFLEALLGYQRTEVVRAALELDLFSHVGAGATQVAELAAATGASPKGIRILSNYLVTLGLLTKGEAGYRLSPDAAVFLDRASSSYLGDTVGFYLSPVLRAGFAHATAAVRRGGSDPAIVNTMAPDHPVWIDYARGMSPMFVRTATSLAALIPSEPAPRRLLDVAAGHGQFGIALAQRFPSARVTALDAAGVGAVARANAEAAGVLDRFEFRVGDALGGDLGRDWDGMVVANFLHHFDAAGCAEFLRTAHAALAPGGWIALVEFVPDEDEVSPAPVAQFGMTMLTTTPAGDVYPFATLADWLVAAGFVDPTLHPLRGTFERALFARTGPIGPPTPL
jgi:SAM-dependent methyltransferase